MWWQNLWDSMMSMYSSRPFLTGLALGVIVCAVAILFFLLVTRVFGASKVSSFSYPVPNGRITIRSSAVISLVFSLGKDFAEFVIVGAGLYRKRKVVFLRVVVDYRQGERPFPDAASLFQQTVLDKLREVFGVKTVKQIEICMRDSIGSSGPRG